MGYIYNSLIGQTVLLKSRIFLWISLLSFSFSIDGFAQLNAIWIGDATSLGNNCYRITDQVDWQVGGVWYDNPIDFAEDFTIDYKNNFGSNDANGADGMALVFKTTSTPVLGGAGGGMGYESIGNLIVEFDTWQNVDLNDPAYDHLSITTNGNPNHASTDNLAGPVAPTSSITNMEDGEDHNIKIDWTASTQTFEVYFDCELRLSIVRDIKNTIFGGDSSVYFGFVGSTGGSSNLHQVCFNSISFVDNLVLQDQTICVGDSVEIDATVPSGDTYTWSPATGVSDVNSPNPTFSPTTTTTYSVTIEDECGESTIESVVINVNSLTSTDFNTIVPICAGDPNPLPATDLNGISGTWSPDFDANTSQTYTFTPDANQCASSNTVTVTISQIVTPDFDAIGSICVNSSNPLVNTDNNGITGSWSPAFDSTATTTYTFTPDAGQCATTVDQTITIISETTPNFSPIADVCFGTSVTIPTTSSEGITGSWSPAFDPTTTTTYTFTPDANQCATTATLTVGITPLTTPNFTSIADVCEGTALTLPTTSNDNITGSWSPAFDSTTTTTYTFTPDADQCADSTSMTIGIISQITPTFSVIPPQCEGTSIGLPTTSTENITGSWSPNFDPTSTTTYTFTPDVNQCATTTTQTVIIKPTLTPTFNPIDPICLGDIPPSLPSTSTNGIAGTWLPAVIDNTNTTTYVFTPDSSSNCEIQTTITVVVLQQTTPTFQIQDICIGENIGSLPTVSLEGITGSWSPAPNNLTTTTYTFTPDPNQCADITTATIVVNPINSLSLDVTNNSEPFASNQIIEVEVTGGSGNYEYQLDGGNWQTNPIFQNVVGCEAHLIKVRDTEGCSNEPETSVTILDYPKFFTPNGDGYNDFWSIKCLRNQAGIISIFDRFGKLLKQFKTNSPGWNGMYNNALMPTNDYWFVVTYYDENGIEKQFRSHFTLRR